MVSWSPKAYAIQWGGGVVAEFSHDFSVNGALLHVRVSQPCPPLNRPLQMVFTMNIFRAAKLSLLSFLSLFRDLQKPTRFSRGGGGGGVVAEFSRYLQLRNQMFTPHSVIFVGRDTHFA